MTKFVNIFAPNIYILLPLVFLRGCLGVMFNPASQGAVRSIVPEELLPGAVTLGELSMRLTQVLAPAIGGVVVAYTNPQVVFMADVVILIIAALILMRLPQLENEPTPQEKKGDFWKEFAEGFQHIRQRRILATCFFMIFLYDGMLALWAKGIELGESSYCLLMSAIGFGNIVGAIVAGQFAFWRKNPLQFIVIAAVFLGLVNIFVGFGVIGAALAKFIGVGGVFAAAGALMTVMALCVLVILPRLVAGHKPLVQPESASNSL